MQSSFSGTQLKGCNCTVERVKSFETIVSGSHMCSCVDTLDRLDLRYTFPGISIHCFAEPEKCLNHKDIVLGTACSQTKIVLGCAMHLALERISDVLIFAALTSVVSKGI